MTPSEMKFLPCRQAWAPPSPKNSTTAKLDPYIDNKGLFWVGRCLRLSKLKSLERRPLSLKRSHRVATLVRHYHKTVIHQGPTSQGEPSDRPGFWTLGIANALCHRSSTAVWLAANFEEKKGTRKWQSTSRPSGDCPPPPSLQQCGSRHFWTLACHHSLH